MISNLLVKAVDRVRRTRSLGRRRKTEAGFTLVELLVVMAILALLASLIAPRVLDYLAASRTKTAKLQIENIGTSLQLFKLDTGRYPKTHEGLDALVTKNDAFENWSGPYLKGGRVPEDPWGNAYRFTYPGRHVEFDIFSFGADNQQGGTDENQDVTNW